MKERQFQTCFDHGGTFLGIHVTPIPDGGRAGGLRVYDTVHTFDGVGHHIELKTVKGKSNTWTINQLKDHQEENLKSAFDNGAMAWVVVWWQIILNKKTRKDERWKDQETYHGCLALQLYQVLEYRDEKCQTGIHLHEFLEHGVYCPELFNHGVTTKNGNQKRLWDPRPLTDPKHRF